MDRSYWRRLQFTRGKGDKGEGAGVWTLSLEEQKSDQDPILTRGLARATVWLEATTGRIVRTDLRIDALPGPSISRTTFRYDEVLQVGVPVEMKTTWRRSASVVVIGTAKYSNFRQFVVRTDERMQDRK